MQRCIGSRGTLHYTLFSPWLTWQPGRYQIAAGSIHFLSTFYWSIAFLCPVHNCPRVFFWHSLRLPFILLWSCITRFKLFKWFGALSYEWAADGPLGSTQTSFISSWLGRTLSIATTFRRASVQKGYPCTSNIVVLWSSPNVSAAHIFDNSVVTMTLLISVPTWTLNLGCWIISSSRSCVLSQLPSPHHSTYVHTGQWCWE